MTDILQSAYEPEQIERSSKIINFLTYVYSQRDFCEVLTFPNAFFQVMAQQRSMATDATPQTNMGSLQHLSTAS